MIAFGPVPSRRLGRSLGINHIPPKVCTYSCVYCQVGRTTRLRVQRSRFTDPAVVASAVRARLKGAKRNAEKVDYLTLVPDGEPTLDERLGRLIQELRPLGLPIAVVTNGSLLDHEDVRAELTAADWVSIKIDSLDEAKWRAVNRPHRRLSFRSVLEGIEAFADVFHGRLVTETMLVAGVNDKEAELCATAAFIGSLAVGMSYLSVPTRPPAEAWVRPASAACLAGAYEIFRAVVGPVELLVGYEGDAFAHTGDAREELLAITAVHPMREQAVVRLLARAGAPPGLIRDLVGHGELVEATYGGYHYYLRPTQARPPRRRVSGMPEENDH